MSYNRHRYSHSSRCCDVGVVIVHCQQQLFTVSRIALIVLLLLLTGSTHPNSVRIFSESPNNNVVGVHAWIVIPLIQKNHHSSRRIPYGWKKQQLLHHPHNEVSTTVDRLVAVKMLEIDTDNEAFSHTDDTTNVVVPPTEFVDNIDNNDTTKRMEQVWRYVKKPLLSIGAQKGPTQKHGNSLRELLHHHTTIKIKIQLLLTRNSDDTQSSIQEQMMIQVYQQLKIYATEIDPTLINMELLQVRVNERILLVALPGTKQKIIDGTYPPPPPPPPKEMIDDPTTTATT